MPVVIDSEGTNIIGYEGLVEYLDEKKVGKTLLGNSLKERLEVRRLLCGWEKITKRSNGKYFR